ncbi:MAG: respiratory nitrate reductase subunit gamma, partial [Acidimicrobiia bacterium]
MSATTRLETEQDASQRSSAVPLIFEVLGAISAAATVLLGLLGTLPEHPHFEIGREVFGNVPDPVVVTFYLGIAGFLWLTFHLLAQRSKSWLQGQPETRWGNWGQRLRRLGQGLRMETLMRDRRMGVIHSMIYYGFIVLFLGTVTLEIDHLLPSNLKFLHGGFYQGYSAILDLASLVYLGGLGLAAANRYGARPWRLKSKTKPEDALILLTLALIGVTGLLTEGARISLAGRPDFEVWSFVGYPISLLMPQASAGDIHLVMWVVHVLTFVAFLVVLPMTKLRHMVTSPANLFLSPHERPKGAMRPMPNLMETDDIETIGASLASDLTWKQIFDTDACTICGRCTSVCP